MPKNVGFAGVDYIDSPPKFYILVLMDAYFAENDEQGGTLKKALRIFDRQMKDRVAIYFPNEGSEDDFNQAVMRKNWTPDQADEIAKTPALLFLTREVYEFDPAQDKFSYLSLDGMLSEDGRLEYKAISRILKDITTELKAGEDIERILNLSRITGNRRKLWRAIELKPGFWGFNVDLKKLFRMR